MSTGKKAVWIVQPKHIDMQAMQMSKAPTPECMPLNRNADNEYRALAEKRIGMRKNDSLVSTVVDQAVLWPFVICLTPIDESQQEA
jgi:hypothetical protein